VAGRFQGLRLAASWGRARHARSVVREGQPAASRLGRPGGPQVPTHVCAAAEPRSLAW